MLLQRPARFIFLIGLLCLLWPGLLMAQEVSQDEVNAVARELFCPTCENTPLDACPTQTCEDWRNVIRQQLNEGRSKPEILDYFVANFGPQVLSEPPREGFNLLVWLLPIILIPLGGLFFMRYLHKLKQASAPISPPSASMTAAASKEPTNLATYREQIEREL